MFFVKYMAGQTGLEWERTEKMDRMRKRIVSFDLDMTLPVFRI